MNLSPDKFRHIINGIDMDNGNNKIGDPLYNAPPAKEETKQSKTASMVQEQKPSTLRSGDHGVGIPDFKPEKIRKLSDQECDKLREEQEARLRSEFEEKLKSLQGIEDKWYLPKGLRKAIGWTLVTAAAVLGLLLVGNGTAFINDITKLQSPFNWICGVSAGVFALIIVAVILKLLWLFVRLRRNPAVNIKAISVLEQRQSFQKLIKQHTEEAKNKLTNYLESYPLTGDGRKKLITIGASESDADALLNAREYLLDKSRPQSAGEWLNDFEKRFQSVIDKIAADRVRQYALRVAAGTALSPIAAVDQMIVLYSSSALIKDMMFIYQLRPAFGQTAVILSRAIVNTYLSGMMEDTAGKAADSLSDSLGEWSSHLSGILGSSLGRTISVKTTEAGLNALLISRLGKRAIKQLQPVIK